MTVLIDKSFEKDTGKIKDEALLQNIAHCIENVIAATSLQAIPALKKLKGFKFHYRIRVGDYRAGIFIKNDTVIFERFIHRKDIYKFFP